MHLRKLRLRRHERLDARAEFLNALRKNGSLHHLHMHYLLRSWMTFTAKDLETLQSYRRRNELVSDLVVMEDEDRRHWSLVPSLFAAARAASRTAPTILVRGLLSLSDSAPWRRGTKRIVQKRTTSDHPK
jgi:hypothetical protein